MRRMMSLYLLDTDAIKLSSTDKVSQIEPKEDLKKRSRNSPNFASAFRLTCTPQPSVPSVRVI